MYREQNSRRHACNEPYRSHSRHDPSDALEAHIRDKAAKLEEFHPQITGCNVAVEMPAKHKHQGKLFNVRMDVRVPGSELVVNRDLNEDVYVALRDAFDAAKRQLEEYAHKQRGDMKQPRTDLAAEEPRRAHRQGRKLRLAGAMVMSSPAAAGARMPERLWPDPAAQLVHGLCDAAAYPHAAGCGGSIWKRTSRTCS